MRCRWFLTLVALSWLGNACAQMPRASAEKLEATAKLDMMVGHWKGRGWWEFTPGNRREFDSEEHVHKRAGGTAFELLGLHTMDRGGQPVVVHDAFAMLWYDERAKRYLMKSAIQTGMIHEFEITLTPTGYTWSHPGFDGKGTVRYVATIGPASWKEVGESSADGREWKQVFEMSLTRQ